jgi:cytochrome c-type biogenesis protein CcmH
MNRRWNRTVCLFFFLVITLCLYAPIMALEWQDVAADLMSPACPGRTLLNCTSGQAEQWRELIRQKITQGETKEQILRYFVDMRGEEILAAPPKRGFALTAWLFPMFIMANGAGLIVILATRWARKNRAENAIGMDAPQLSSQNILTSDPYRNRLQKELEDFTA